MTPATGFQVESNPQIFKTIIRDTLREAIDTAKKALEAQPQDQPKECGEYEELENVHPLFQDILKPFLRGRKQ